MWHGPQNYLNGSGRVNLFKAYKNAVEKLQEAIEAVSQNGLVHLRDYQGFTKDYNEDAARTINLADEMDKLRADLETTMIGIYDCMTEHEKAQL